MITILDDLKKLCNASGCAGQNDICVIAKELLSPLVDEIDVDAMGNVLAIRRSDTPNAKTVMLEAHLDEIGFMVTHIDERGFVFVDPAGGIDKRMLSAQPVVIHGHRPIDGVFSCVPPHLSKGDEKLPEISDLAIDAGLSGKSAKELIPLGSRVTFAPRFVQLSDTVVTAKSLDDRSGMAAILHCLRQLKNRKMNVAVAFCVQEELGCRGAAVATKGINPDYAIVTDVSFARTQDSDTRKCGEMRKGAMIGISPVLDANMSNDMKAVAQQYNIKHQFEVMSGSTGTDADNISVSAYGVPTALLSIPLRYMHTPVETIDATDVTAVGDLMAAWIEQKGAQING